MHAVASGEGCTLRQESNLGVKGADWHYLDAPALQGPIDRWSRGLLTDETPPPDWLGVGALYDEVRCSGVLVTHEIGYDAEGCFGGHVLELVLPSGESLQAQTVL